MTWRHRGIPYGRSTGNFLRVDTVSHKPANPVPETANTRAVGIIDNEDQSTGTGIGLYSRNALILATVDNASWEENCGLEIVTIDAGGAADIILSSGRLVQGDNGNIEITTCRASTKPHGDILIRSGELGSGVGSGDITLSCQDSAVLGAQGVLAITANQGGMSVRDFLHLEAATDFPIPSTLDLSSAGCALSGECFSLSGDDTLASDIDAYAGGLTIGSTGGVLTLNDLATTPGPIAPPANFSGTMTIAGVEVPYY